MPDLHTLTGTELVAGYRTGAIRPSEALAACLARVEQVNPVLNAIVTLDRASAAAAAARSDRRWAAGQPLSAIDGVPTTVKDNLKQRGVRATWGSVAFADHVPARDELAVARLRDAGAVLIGKTNTPELSLAGTTTNDLFGPTGNPWASDLTPGGSSGGAVAAVMSAMAPLALATDAGGSIRRPAGYTGAVGLRTSPGLVPRRYGFPALTHDLQTIGPIARCVADLSALLTCLSGAAAPADRAASLTELRVGVVGAIEHHPVEDEILSRLQDVAARLADAGAAVEPLERPWEPDEVGAFFLRLASVGVAATMAAPMKAGVSPTPTIATLAEAGASLDAIAYCRMLADIAEQRWRAADLFASVDVILSPTSAAMPWTKSEMFPAVIAGVKAAPRASAIYTTFANVAGLPALAFPAAPAADGRPIGMQLVGPAGSDWRLLALGAELERLIERPKVAPDDGLLRRLRTTTDAGSH